jgi:hydrogenase maturation protein HypF
MSNLLSQKYNIKKVALSGGVFHNEILLKGIYEKLTNQGFEVLTHKLVPTNDSGISLGQLVIANNNIKEI